MNFKNLFFLLSLLCASFVFTSCDKDKDDDGNKQDDVFLFNCKVDGKDWSSEKIFNALTAQYYKIDTLPAALISNDSVLIAASAKVGDYATTIVMMAKHTNAADVTGTYPMTGSIVNIPSSTSIGLYVGKDSDLLTYLSGGLTGQLEYAEGSKLVISKHANNKISGTFNFKIQTTADKQVVYNVTDGKFQNMELKQ